MVVGSIIMFPGSAVPSGYLLCDGSAVSRTTYASLFTAIGTTYGAGDGSTTFNLPNLAGRVPVGSSQSHQLGTSGGEESHTLTSGEIASHVHEVPQHGHADDISVSTPGLSHTVGQAAFQYTYLSSAKSFSSVVKKATVYTSQNTGTMTQSTSLAVGDHDAAACTKAGGVTDCPAFNTASAGSGAAHNNMMPFLAMNYIIYAASA